MTFDLSMAMKFTVEANNILDRITVQDPCGTDAVPLLTALPEEILPTAHVNDYVTALTNPVVGPIYVMIALHDGKRWIVDFFARESARQPLLTILAFFCGA